MSAHNGAALCECSLRIGVEGLPIDVAGVDLWEVARIATGSHVTVAHPQYPRQKHMTQGMAAPIRFAAGEFSKETHHEVHLRCSKAVGVTGRVPAAPALSGSIFWNLAVAVRCRLVFAATNRFAEFLLTAVATPHMPSWTHCGWLGGGESGQAASGSEERNRRSTLSRP
jgi:hypothetical protein